MRVKLYHEIVSFEVAGRGGFEPPVSCPTAAFQARGCYLNQLIPNLDKDVFCVRLIVLHNLLVLTY